MDNLDCHEWITRESELFAAALDHADLDARVPGCPEWALRDLASHLARVQRFWAGVVRAGADVEPQFPGNDKPVADPDIAAWMRASTRKLLDALHAVSPDAPAWVWWRENRTVGAIARHQVQEAAVHRWDAQSAIGTPDPLAAEVADDGVDEFMWIARQMRGPAPIMLVATDSGRSFPASDDPPRVTVSAPASDLVLILYGRISADQVQVDGDRATLDEALMPIG